MTGAILSVLARERTKSNDESNSITHTQWRPFWKEGPPRKAESLQRLNAARCADEKAGESQPASMDVVTTTRKVG